MKSIFQNKKFRILLACVALLLLMDLIQDTYAKYISTATAEGEFTIARWAFSVNSQDVISDSDFSNTIIPHFDTNTHIASDVIAPTSTGYFTVTIDSSEVEVSFTDTITVSRSQSSTVSDIVFTGYKINNGPVVTLNDVSATTITTNHTLNVDATSNTYYFYIKWLDGTGETMDNADDTEAAEDGVAAVDVNINFTQRATS